MLLHWLQNSALLALRLEQDTLYIARKFRFRIKITEYNLFTTPSYFTRRRVHSDEDLSQILPYFCRSSADGVSHRCRPYVFRIPNPSLPLSFSLSLPSSAFLVCHSQKDSTRYAALRLRSRRYTPLYFIVPRCSNEFHPFRDFWLYFFFKLNHDI